MSFWKKIFGSKSDDAVDSGGEFWVADEHAEVNRRDDNGWTALMSAVMDDEGGLVLNQLGQGADVNIRDNEGLTALMLAARFSHGYGGTSHVTIAMSLLEHGAEIELRDSMGKTALMHAASSNASSLVALLLKHGADINAQDRDGRTALMSSASAIGSFPDAALVLLEHGADVDLKDRKGHTALMSSAAFGQASLADELVRLGAQVNHQGSDGMTALMFAAREGQANVIETLLERGADPELHDRSGLSALDYATARGHLEAVALLDVSTEAGTRGADIHIRAEPNSDTGATEVGSDAGSAAVYVFDYEQMGSAYGAEAFDAIARGLDGSTGMCTFLHGDLDVAAGGPSRVPGLLKEIRDNGWNITSHRADSPLVLLATEEAIYAYVAVLWTTNAENIDRLHAQLSAVLPDAYLGNLCHPEYLDIEKFQEVFRPLSLPVWGSFFDGASQQE